MMFLVNIRWKLAGEEKPFESYWMVRQVRSDAFALILDTVQGFEVHMPWGFIQLAQFDVKG